MENIIYFIIYYPKSTATQTQSSERFFSAHPVYFTSYTFHYEYARLCGWLTLSTGQDNSILTCNNANPTREA